MNVKQIAALALIASLVPVAADARGGGGGRSFGGAGGARPAGGARTAPSGGFDLHNEGGGTRSTTTPGGASHSTSVNNTGGTYTKNSTTSTSYGTHSTSTSANPTTGNYNRNASGSNQYGTYNSSASGNAYNKTYNRTTTATNAYGQTYHGGTAVNNGYVYHGAVVTNPVYRGYPAWGWNAGVAWYAAPYYWGGGFWGAMALGTAAAITYGTVAANNETVTSYEVQPDSPGAKLLSSYGLTQTPCGPPSLVVIYGPNNSVICAKPNQLVSAGNYSVNSSTLTIVSEKA